MKNYFCKFLPVEGEIKEGDYWTHSGLRPKKIVDIDKKVNLKEHPELKTKRDYLKLRDAKLCKLFLCSRDIKVGDKVKHIESTNFYTIKEITKNEGSNPDEIKLLSEGLLNWYSFEEGGLGTTKNTLKVIGEVSPDSLSYVKEGDEFDVSDFDFGDFECRLYPENKEGKVYIKGPCGHFH